jgi:predicted phage tail component-like protein
MADFTGFSYNGVHSSELGLTVVSGGNRLSTNLLPTFKDKTTTVEGRHGNYFYGSTYDNRTFNISVAFDDLHEEQIRRIQLLFKKQEIGELIFDEAPYKVYLAKLNSAPRLDFICFDGPVRIYKGELSLNFISYAPFARSQYNYLDDYRKSERHYTNIDEWAWASGMKEIKDGYDEYVSIDESTGKIKVFNAGDFPADYIITIQVQRLTGIEEAFSILYFNLTDTIKYKIGYSLPEYDEEGNFVLGSTLTIDTNKKLIAERLITEAGESNHLNVRNDYLVSGDLFLLPEGESIINIFRIPSDPSLDIVRDISIQYSHLYL